MKRREQLGDRVTALELVAAGTKDPKARRTSRLLQSLHGRRVLMAECLFMLVGRPLVECEMAAGATAGYAVTLFYDVEFWEDLIAATEARGWAAAHLRRLAGLARKYNESRLRKTTAANREAALAWLLKRAPTESNCPGEPL